MEPGVDSGVPGATLLLMADAERISRAQFRGEALDFLPAAGLGGPFEPDVAGGRLLTTSTGSFDLREAYDNA